MSLAAKRLCGELKQREHFRGREVLAAAKRKGVRLGVQPLRCRRVDGRLRLRPQVIARRADVELVEPQERELGAKVVRVEGQRGRARVRLAIDRLTLDRLAPLGLAPRGLRCRLFRRWPGR